jgi:predicted transcriptional regulator
MNNSETISIILSPAQVDQVVRAAARGTTPGFSSLISSKLARGQAANGAPDDDAGASGGGGFLPVSDDARLSRSLLRGLSILTCFGSENKERGILEMASQLGMSPSTTHRYVSTLVELGLLERSPRTRKYRLALTPEGTGAKRHQRSKQRRERAKTKA